jgi:hypothetical protein
MIKQVILTILAGLIFVHFGCGEKQQPVKERKINILSSEKEQDTLKEFAYVALAYGKPSVYKYNIDQGNFELLWWNQNDFVIALVPDYETNISFFITARSVGRRGNFSFISKIKLYRIEPDHSAIDFISDIGNAIQLNAYWNDNRNFELVFTDVDKSISSYINKYVQVYNTFGKMIDDKVETFDITKTGFPQLLPRKSPTVSKSGWYGISEINDSIYLRIAGAEEERFITSIEGDFLKVDWSEDEDYLFFSSSGMEPDFKNTGLYIYDINGDSLVTSWTGPGRKDFFTSGDLLIFEDGLAENSFIVVYNFKETEQINSFTRKGGSGLKNISR